jgi:hypothetical protein
VGGDVRLSLHPPGFAWRDLLRRMRVGTRATAGGLWSIVNGCFLLCFGQTWKMPFSRHFYDSFQTYGSMRRLLKKHGVAEELGEIYTLRAKKRT